MEIGQLCGHLERSDLGDLVSAYRRIENEEVRDSDRGEKSWDKCMRNDLVELGLSCERAFG